MRVYKNSKLTTGFLGLLFLSCINREQTIIPNSCPNLNCSAIFKFIVQNWLYIR